MEFGALKMRFIMTALSLIGASDGVLQPIEMYEFLLPIIFKPISYTLDITTHLENKFAFEGVVDIRVACEETFSVIVLHAVGLDVDKKRVKCVDKAGNPVKLREAWFMPEVDFMYVRTLNGDFQRDEEYVLTIPFAGNITDDLVGYYKNSYVDKSTNQTKWLAATQFEPAYARTAFPCFDEPGMKATFKIKLRHVKELTSVSNMRLKKTSPDPSNPNYVLDEFEESEPMSTYQVAYMVSDLAYVDARVMPPNDMPYRMIARRAAVDQTEVAANVGTMALNYYEKHFDQQFPSTKMDMVALPERASDATENWGLLAYRESTMLVDANVDTIDDMHHDVQIVARQIAHMWFGNLVTIKWWTELWMKEGFATYYASRLMDKLYPRWFLYQLETVENFLNVLELDSLQSSHPVSLTINHVDEIAQLSDTITHAKGSFLLHMINQFLSEKIFKRSIRNYLEKYKFANADQEDLWDVLTNETRRAGCMPKRSALTVVPSQIKAASNSSNIKHRKPRSIQLNDIMNSWSWQPGYPVVKVIRNYTAGIMTISQERFYALKMNETERVSWWWVPLTMTTASEANFKSTKAQIWFHHDHNGMTLPLAKTEEWVVFNIRMSGLYRVMYDELNWLSIIYTLKHPYDFKDIHPVNRAQLIDDALTFAQVGDLDYGIVFKLLSYLEHEDEYIPWMAAIRRLSPIGRLMKRTPHHGLYQAFMRRMLQPVYHKDDDMAYEPNHYDETRLKNLVFFEACHNRLKNCTDQAQKLFQKLMKSPDSDRNGTFPRERKPTIYCEAAKHGGVGVWDFLWKRYERSNVAGEKSKLLSALGCTTETRLLRRYLDWTVGENSVIPKQEAITVFRSVSSNELGYSLAKDFLYKKFKEITKHYRHRIGEYVKAIGIEMKTKKELDELQSFIKRAKAYIKGAERSVSQTIEIVEININWMTKFYDKFVEHIDTEKAKDRRRLAMIHVNKSKSSLF